MDSLTPDGATTTAPRTSFAHRYKPRANARVQLALAGTLWLVASAILGIRGAGWLLDADRALALFALAGILAVLKYRYILTPTSLRAIDRIHSRGTESCAGGFLSWKTWLLVLVMMAGGHALRLTAIPRPALGVLYVTISLALLAGAVRFWRAAVGPRC